MKALFIGGTGNISSACSALAIERGIELYHLNRGNRSTIDGAIQLRADIRNIEEVRRAIDDLEFDCVADFIAFTPEQIAADIELFGGRTNQYLFISSATVYHKPPSHYLISETMPTFNPFSEYATNKIACERKLQDEYEKTGFPFTIVRPSHTYSVGWLPTTFGSSDFTVPQRMLDGKPIVVHGDGESLWTLTHSEDFAKGFVGLMGHPRAIGESFHITGDEALSWNQIHRIIARALGVEAEIVHVTSDEIAKLAPEYGPGLLGDQAFSLVFDNSKIKRYVSDYAATISFHEGVDRSLAWLMEDPARRKVNSATDSLIEGILG